ncbi:type VII secretion protein EssB [Bacillus hominis]|uniref:Type VII secretion protein EssB n=1 Tax=Bacillus hominis TaxID=2817478 RepID=A0ABT7RFG5_9BACI|nr:type VII secretion protein EssB [Bacillus hominis]MDM5191261.1 type VII secretion protein EssB [Bacillus hominis]MDM5436399.1 type VII secretion protein EssB [Bacillus hominis]MDM5441660.1 type VII secretion protein EssB [Bacillus hominis]
MTERTIQLDSMQYLFETTEHIRKLKLSKSQTRVKDIRQLELITGRSNFFVPATVEDHEDMFTFEFDVKGYTKEWEDVQKLGKNDKLRLLLNVARFQECLQTRKTFFLHPDNLVFDDNYMPYLVYRGIRDIVPPYRLDDEKFLRQYKCLVVALFSKKYSFDELYSGSLNNAKDTAFERNVVEVSTFDDLVKLLNDHYRREQTTTEKNMQLVSKKRFRLFKQLSILMIVASIVLAVPLGYFSFVKMPYQNKLLEADKNFLATDYDKVISTLKEQDPEKLPDASKYVLASSYVKAEKLTDDQKAAIMKNVSLKSDKNYLLYWIYNGRGDFSKSLDLAKYIDDPQLIMYGLIKQIEQAKNDPKLTGSTREEKVQKYQQQLEDYQKKYNTNSSDDLSNENPSGNKAN